MTKSKKPFGEFKPSSDVLRKINWCQKLPVNWLGKQVAQLLRKSVISQTSLPLDLEFDQIKLRCQLTDNKCESDFIFMPGHWEKVEREVLLKALPAEGVFIDIGANVGIFSAIAASKINRLGAVVAIEPNPLAFDRMTFNLTATKKGLKEQPRIETLQLSVGDHNGDVDLYLDDGDLGASSSFSNNNGSQPTKMVCAPLIDVINQLKLSRVDVIKCNSNGAEDQALIPFLMEAPHHLLPHCFILKRNEAHWQAELLEILSHRSYHQTHQTKLNYIYQLRQPIHLNSSHKRVSGPIPVIQ